MYGRRGRIGALVPAGNSVVEPEFQRMAPDGVMTLAGRVMLKDVTPASLRAMRDDTARAAAEVADARVGVIAFACTSGSFVGGPDYDRTLISLIEDATGVPATTTTSAVLRALRLLKVRRLAMATPYTDEVTALEADFLETNGFEVVAWKGGGMTGVADIQECPPEISAARAREIDRPEAEAVFISCTGFRTIENIETLEADLGKPVVTSNQATFADCLRLLGVDDVQPGYGSLFDATFAGTAPEETGAVAAAS
ncbi:MAG: maleate cis-trans isomerase family protein [Methyloligellaceae bacterium]